MIFGLCVTTAIQGFPYLHHHLGCHEDNPCSSGFPFFRMMTTASRHGGSRLHFITTVANPDGIHPCLIAAYYLSFSYSPLSVWTRR